MNKNIKAPSQADVHIGKRIRIRRMLLGVSQEKLGEVLGVTFQQIQKYEKGANRISAGRLQHIGSILGVPASYFYAGLSDGEMKSNPIEGAVVDVMSTNEGLRLAKAFAVIDDRQLRFKLVELAEAISQSGSQIL